MFPCGLFDFIAFIATINSLSFQFRKLDDYLVSYTLFFVISDKIIIVGIVRLIQNARLLDPPGGVLQRHFRPESRYFNL